MQTIRIGTRGSPLALWQANFVAHRLREVAAGRTVEMVIIQTQGDQIATKPLAQIGGDGLFTKAIQDVVLAGGADVAVHSLKDLPTIPIEGLILAAVPPRASTRDAFLSTKFASFDALPQGARVATGSMRRKSQILHRRPEPNLVDIRGNVESRLRKLREQDLDGLILAEAGLVRSGSMDRLRNCSIKAGCCRQWGRGSGLECRSDDRELMAILNRLDDPPTHQATAAERSLLRALGGGCQIPLGAQGIVTDGMLPPVCRNSGTRRFETPGGGSARKSGAGRGIGPRNGEGITERVVKSICYSGSDGILPPNTRQDAAATGNRSSCRVNPSGGRSNRFRI